MSRSASRSGSTPSRIMPPSRASAGGSSTSADASASRTSARSSSSPTRLPTSGAAIGSSTRRTRGIAASDWRSATRSRGPAVPIATRPTSRSRSWTARSVSRSRPRSVALKANSSTASRRSWIRSSAVSGRISQARSAPRAHHRLRPIEHRQQRAVAAALGALEDLEVAERHRIDQQAVLPLAPADGADVGEVDLLRVAQVLDQRAGGARRGGMAVQPEGVQAAGAQLIAQRLRGAIDAERPFVERRDGDAEARDLGQQRHRLDALRHDHLARAQHAQLLVQRLASVGAGVLRGQELAGRGVEQRHAEPIAGPVAPAPAGRPARARRGSWRRSGCRARRRA